MTKEQVADIKFCITWYEAHGKDWSLPVAFLCIKYLGMLDLGGAA